MRKLLYSSAVLLSAISSSAPGAEPSLLLERLNKEHIISAEPQSPFTADQSGAAQVTKPLSHVPAKQQATQKREASEQEIRALKRKLVESQRETETLRKKQIAAASVQPKSDAGSDNKQQQPLAINNENKQLQQQLQTSEKQLAEANSKREEANHHIDAAAKKMSEQALRITTLKNELQQRSEEKTQAEQQLAEAKKQGADLSAKLQQAATKTAEQEKQLADANKKRDDVTSQLAAATQQTAGQTSQLAALEATLKQRSEEKTQAEQQLAEAKKQSADLSAKLQQAATKTAEQEKQLADANKKRDDVTSQLAAATQQTAGQTSQLAALEATLKQRSEEKTQAEQQLAEAKKLGADLSAKLQQTAAKTAEQEKQFADANKKRDEVTGQLATATKQAADQASQITTLEAKLKLSGEEKAQIEQQLAAAKSVPLAKENGASKASAPGFSLAADKSEPARVNYAWGVWFAAKVQLESETLKDIGQQFMPQAFLQGLQDKFAGSLQMPNADLEKVLSTLNKQVDDARQRDIARNKKQGQQLLADAAKLKGAVRAENGVIYLVEKRGPGAPIGDNDVIRFKVDEKVSSGQVLAQGEVNTARVSELPLVMRTGVKKLVVGGRVKIYVPTDLAYGEEGIPGAVPPGVTSVMTLEIMGIEK